MMYDDPIVDEIRQIRKQHTDKFGGDIHAICEDLRRLERESGRQYVSFPPRPVVDQTVPYARKRSSLASTNET